MIRYILIALLVPSNILFFWACSTLGHKNPPTLIEEILPPIADLISPPEFRNTLLILTNAERGNALILDEKLCQDAQWWAEQMASMQSLRHSKLPYGENIAYGYEDEQAVMQGWMKSKGHKANIQNSRYTHVGFGKATDANGEIWWCTVFT